MSLSLSFLNLSLNLSLNLWFVKARHRPGCFYAESKRLCCSTGVDLKDRWRNLQKREDKPSPDKSTPQKNSPAKKTPAVKAQPPVVKAQPVKKK